MATDTKEKYTDKQKKNEPDALENQSMKTLIEKAREKYISGRSTMNKVELIQALRRS
jgi:hypothetical protein